MKFNGAEITIKLLERQNITTIAGIPGGANLPLYHALYQSKIRHLLARHEQGAGFIAQGMARASGKAAVCFATSGPGATNLLTAIADAKLDSIPVIAITGQVSASYIGTDAFQEVDTYGMSIPITKHNFLVRSARELFTVIPEAFRIAESGRPGPVLIDIPKDVQTEKIEFKAWPEPGKRERPPKIRRQHIRKAAMIINAAERPLLYIGGGLVHSNAYALLQKFARKNSIPVASTLMGLGVFPPDDPLSLGMLGMHGARCTNFILEESDVLLAFGVRFDDRATGNIKKFCPNAAIVHIDIDRSEIDKLKQSHCFIEGDVGEALQALLPLIRENQRPEWTSFINKMKKEHPLAGPRAGDGLHPINLIKRISELAGKDAIIATDVGQHQMWTAQRYAFRRSRSLLTSGGLGTMGFGLPAAIGASLADPEKRVICISGDGSLLMNIQELATLADTRANVTVIVLNNRHLGLVRQQQELFYGKKYIASKFISNPDFCAIARGFGIRSYELKKGEDPKRILKQALSRPGPCLINALIRPNENVLPMVPPGAGNTEMIGGEENEHETKYNY